MTRQRSLGFIALIAGIVLSYFFYWSNSKTLPRISTPSINTQPTLSSKTTPQTIPNKSSTKPLQNEPCKLLFDAIEFTQARSSSDEFNNCSSRISNSQNIEKIIRFCLAWAKVDLLSALDFAANLGPLLRPYVLPMLIQKSVTINSVQLEEWLALQNDDHRFILRQAFYRGLAEIDPQHALSEVLSLTAVSEKDMEQKKHLLIGVFEQWGASNAEQALHFVREQKLLDTKLEKQLQNIETHLMITLIKQNDQTAERMILELDSSQDKAILVQHMVQHLAQIDQQLAVEWAQGISDIVTRKAAIGAAFQYWAETDVPAETIISAIMSEPNTLVRQSLTSDAVSALASRDSKELAAVYDQFPEKEQPHIAEKIALFWANSDHQAALNWASNLPSGEAKDAAIYSIATNGLHNFERPTRALNYAQLISDPNIQFETNKAILLSVASDNKLHAQNLVEQVQGLNHQQKKALYLLLQ